LFHIKNETSTAVLKPVSDETYKIEDELEERGNGGKGLFAFTGW
jgi:hypothetical protein